MFPKVAHKIMSSDLETAEAVDGLLEVRTSNNAKFFSCPAPGILPTCSYGNIVVCRCEVGLLCSTFVCWK